MSLLRITPDIPRHSVATGDASVSLLEGRNISRGCRKSMTQCSETSPLGLSSELMFATSCHTSLPAGTHARFLFYLPLSSLISSSSLTRLSDQSNMQPVVSIVLCKVFMIKREVLCRYQQLGYRNQVVQQRDDLSHDALNMSFLNT